LFAVVAVGPTEFLGFVAVAVTVAGTIDEILGKAPEEGDQG